jgi:hypothetical protein
VSDMELLLGRDLALTAPTPPSHLSGTRATEEHAIGCNMQTNLIETANNLSYLG